jgi:hypothetical protein
MELLKHALSLSSNPIVNMIADFVLGTADNLFNGFVRILGICGFLFGLGAVLTLLGAFTEYRIGRRLIIHGAVLSFLGILGFCYVWNEPFSLVNLPVSGTFSELSTRIGFSVSWGWSYGLYLAFVSAIITLVSIVMHPKRWEEPTSSLPEVPQRPQSKSSSWHEHQTPTAEEPHVASPWKRTDAMAHGVPSSPLLCSVGIHNWRYYGDPEQVVIQSVSECLEEKEAMLPLASSILRQEDSA